MGVRNFMDSKILALSVLILLIATLVSIGCALLPFWFRLSFSAEDATFGSMGSRTDEMQIGLFYIYKPNKPGPERTKVLMTSLLAMDKATNLPVVPPLFRIGQIFYTIGAFGITVAMGGAFILAFRELGSLTGNCGLAFFTMLSAIFQVFGVLFALFTVFDSGSEWHELPLDEPFRRIVITSHPTMYLDWGFYIAIIGAAISVFGGVLLVIETMSVCKSVEGIRRRQMTSKAPEEPYPDIRYTRFSYANVPRPKAEPVYEYSHPHSTPGVILSRGPPPPQQFIAQPQPSPQPPRYGEPSPQPSIEYKPPPGDVFVSRQVDL